MTDEDIAQVLDEATLAITRATARIKALEAEVTELRSLLMLNEGMVKAMSAERDHWYGRAMGANNG